MDDLISREDALKALDEMSYKSPHESATSVVRKKHFGEILEKFIMQQPSAQRWIPVEKETPILPNIVIVCDSLGKILFDSYIDGSWTYCPYVVAWMPLPEPWRGENNET